MSKAKISNIWRCILLFGVIITTLSCVSEDESASSSLRSIASLRELSQQNSCTMIASNITIEGWVTANDKYGEFSSCIIVEDSSAAVKILCDVDSTHALYPMGSHLRIACSGLYLLDAYGALTLGAEPSGEYTLDYIAQSKVGIYIKAVDPSEPPLEPTAVGIEELTPLHIFRYVELNNMSFTQTEESTKYCQRDSLTGRTIDTTHTLTDPYSQSIELRVDSLCEYADTALPTTPCTIRAIVGYFDSQYYLTISNYGVAE